jgi:circadian clock protein KaiC
MARLLLAALGQGTAAASAESRFAHEETASMADASDLPSKGEAETRASTGIEGLDEVLRGGLMPNRLYLVEGVPGSGKTTLGLQFLLEGARRGEPVLYVTLSETEEEVREVAASHGWSLDGIAIHEMLPSEEALRSDEQYTMFHSSEVELSQTTETILTQVERLKPTRVVFDSLSELRLLANTPLRFRRQILSLKRFFSGRRSTILMLDDMTAGNGADLQVESIAHGVILLDRLNPEYGGERRRLRVIKLRGVAFRGGFHDYAIRHGGLTVFPRMAVAQRGGTNEPECIASGIPELDGLLGGGLERATSTLFIGPPGTGKSSLAAQFAAAAAARGERAAMFLFDEGRQTLIRRAAHLGNDLNRFIHEGLVMLQQIDPGELCPGELAADIRCATEKHKASVVVIDSLNGYFNAMPEEHFLVIHLRELLTFLAHADVATILVATQQGLIGTQMRTPIDTSYLADTVVNLRYFEAAGEVRQAISVVKKRSGEHERLIREMRLENGRIRIGEPLREFRGVLSGIPTYEGKSGTLLESRKPLTEGKSS